MAKRKTQTVEREGIELDCSYYTFGDGVLYNECNVPETVHLSPDQQADYESQGWFIVSTDPSHYRVYAERLNGDKMSEGAAALYKGVNQ